MKKAIIIGASSGIGKALALELSSRGYHLGISARREELLKQIAGSCSNPVFIKVMDAEKHLELREKLGELIAEMGGVDIVIYNAGIGESSGQWDKENQMHQINAIGFAAVANFAFNYFRRNKKPGQIVGVSSVAGTRGMRHAIGYGATKAFMWNYMQGQRHKAAAEKLPITITDIRPGFIATDMTKGQAGMFWVQTAEKAARQIADAIESKRAVAYITRRWWLVGKAFAWVPDFIWHKL
ncbi:MAG: SDR family NAD(P)-dependent oxidoreductase [Chitinophagales bacterium]